MDKVKSLEELKKMRDKLRSDLELREKSNNADNMVQIKVSMATCGIAAGAKEVMSYIINTLNQEKIDAVITQTACMGYCYAEPTIEVKLPNQEPVVYGHVNEKRAKEIIDKYIKTGEMVDDILPANFSAEARDIETN